jgi:hypothetical protein
MDVWCFLGIEVKTDNRFMAALLALQNGRGTTLKMRVVKKTREQRTKKTMSDKSC